MSKTYILQCYDHGYNSGFAHDPAYQKNQVNSVKDAVIDRLNGETRLISGDLIAIPQDIYARVGCRPLVFKAHDMASPHRYYFTVISDGEKVYVSPIPYLLDGEFKLGEKAKDLRHTWEGEFDQERYEGHASEIFQEILPTISINSSHK